MSGALCLAYEWRFRHFEFGVFISRNKGAIQKPASSPTSAGSLLLIARLVCRSFARMEFYRSSVYKSSH